MRRVNLFMMKILIIIAAIVTISCSKLTSEIPLRTTTIDGHTYYYKVDISNRSYMAPTYDTLVEAAYEARLMPEPIVITQTDPQLIEDDYKTLLKESMDISISFEDLRKILVEKYDEPSVKFWWNSWREEKKSQEVLQNIDLLKKAIN